MKPRICAAIVNNDLAAIREVEPLVELFELRIDLIGSGWADIAKDLKKPWIACLRSRDEGGEWAGNEGERTETLINALDSGAAIIDIELESKPDAETIKLIRRKAKCLVSRHYLNGTPPLAELEQTVREQMAIDADICKVITTAHGFADNITTLELIAAFPGVHVVSFAMGLMGTDSRVLSPLAGGYFTYASISPGKESAPGQLTVGQLRRIYGMVITR